MSSGSKVDSSSSSSSSIGSSSSSMSTALTVGKEYDLEYKEVVDYAEYERLHAEMPAILSNENFYKIGHAFQKKNYSKVDRFLKLSIHIAKVRLLEDVENEPLDPKAKADIDSRDSVAIGALISHVQKAYDAIEPKSATALMAQEAQIKDTLSARPVATTSERMGTIFPATTSLGMLRQATVANFDLIYHMVSGDNPYLISNQTIRASAKVQTSFYKEVKGRTPTSVHHIIKFIADFIKEVATEKWGEVNATRFVEGFSFHPYNHEGSEGIILDKAVPPSAVIKIKELFRKLGPVFFRQIVDITVSDVPTNPQSQIFIPLSALKSALRSYAPLASKLGLELRRTAGDEDKEEKFPGLLASILSIDEKFEIANQRGGEGTSTGSLQTALHRACSAPFDNFNKIDRLLFYMTTGGVELPDRHGAFAYSYLLENCHHYTYEKFYRLSQRIFNLTGRLARPTPVAAPPPTSTSSPSMSSTRLHLSASSPLNTSASSPSSSSSQSGLSSSSSDFAPVPGATATAVESSLSSPKPS